MEITAKLNNYRQSPRKVRLVLDLIRGLDTQDALTQLKFLNKRSANPVMKLLLSAMANAEHNFSLDQNNLYIKKIYAEAGRTLKRWKPRAFGRTAPILKKSCHISLILEEKLAGLSADLKKMGSSLSAGRQKANVFLPKSDQTADVNAKDVKPLKKIEEPKVVKNLKEIKSKLEKEKKDIHQTSSEAINAGHEINHRLPEEKQEKRKNVGKFKGFAKKMFTRKVG